MFKVENGVGKSVYVVAYHEGEAVSRAKLKVKDGYAEFKKPEQAFLFAALIGSDEVIDNRVKV